jgi:predicted  nucleic acid-binding Zn-ribbon protein
MSPTKPNPRSSETSEGRLGGERNVVAELDNIFRLASAAERSRPAAPAPEPRRMTQPDLDAALDMLSRAAKAMDALQTRYQHVEAYAKEVAERAEQDLAAAYSNAKEWEARAALFERKLDEARMRIAEAERRAEDAERRSQQAERSAGEAREWLECFYDKIVASFDARPFMKSAAA